MGRIWIGILVAGLGWGTGGVATRATLDQGTSPMAIAVYRGLIATVAVVVFLAIQRRGIPRTTVAWKVGLVMGLSNLALPFVLSNIALQYASAGFLGLMMALIPIFTAVIAHFALVGERLTLLRFAGLSIALAGVAALLVSGDSGLPTGGRPVFAGVLGLISVIAIAYGGVYAKRYAGQYRPMDVSGVHFLSGTLSIFAVSLVVEGWPGGETAVALSLIAYLGVMCTFMPFVIFYWLLKKVSATYASMVGYVVPLIAIVAGITLLDERLQPGIIVGGLLILAGVTVTDRSYRLEGRQTTPVESPDPA